MLGCLLCAEATLAQDLDISGFLEFEGHYGANFDTKGSVEALGFGVEGALNFDYQNSTKAGLTYGAHLELDFYQSDDLLDGELRGLASYDVAQFNDGYVFVEGGFGRLALGDVDVAGRANNQLNVPLFANGAYQIGELSTFTEQAKLLYTNRFGSIDVEASIDDDANYGLGLGYSAQMGPAAVVLGVSGAIHDESPLVTPLNPTGEYSEWAASVRTYIGRWRMGANYASVDFPRVYALEYSSFGGAYDFGDLKLGAGVETFIVHQSGVGGEIYTTNLFAGATYALAPGLTLGLGIGNLDADNDFNTLTQPPAPATRKRTTNLQGSVKIDF
jgi:hypothetical protein